MLGTTRWRLSECAASCQGRRRAVSWERPILNADVVSGVTAAPEETRFAVAVALFGQLLRGDPYVHEGNYETVLSLAQEAKGADTFGYRAAFTQIVRLAESAAALPALADGQ